MLAYIAAPYSNVENKEHLMSTIEKVCADFMVEHKGWYAITGLIHHYALKHNSQLGSDWNFWKDFCIEFLEKSDLLIVIKYPGWDKSAGVAAEIEYAKQINLPIQYLSL